MDKLIDSSVVAGAIRLYFGDKVSDVLPLSCSYNEELKRLAQVLTVFFSDGIPSVKVGIYLDKNGLKYSVFGDTYASVAEKCGSELMSSIYLNHVSLCKAIETYLDNLMVENEETDTAYQNIVKNAFLHSGKEAKIIKEMYGDAFESIIPNRDKYLTFLQRVEADGRIKELNDILKRYWK